MQPHRFIVLTILFSALVLSACDNNSANYAQTQAPFQALSTETELAAKESNEEQIQPPQRGDLIIDDADAYLASIIYTKEALSPVLVTAHKNAAVRYDVTVHKIKYMTEDVNGELIKASGIIAVPNYKDTASAILSHQTSSLNENIPSHNPLAETIPLLASAAGGYISVVQDYIGFGESQGSIHPYLNAKVSANSGIDMLRAAKTFLNDNSIDFNDKLYLSGYAEGGYVTMAIHKAIEEHFADEFRVTLSFPAAGAYHLSNMLKTSMESNTVNNPALLGLLIKSYEDNYSEMQGLMLRAVKAPYYQVLQNAYDGNNTLQSINDQLSTVTNELLYDTFISDYLDSQAEKPLKNLLQQNSLYNWTPRTPIRLFHGKKDETIPYFNTEAAAKAMKANGSDVLLPMCESSKERPANHENCSQSYATYLINKLLSRRN